ncbi:alpha/beta fold hydrolase [Methanogenium organophilum]|uniref:Alpha/beta fold hydrolase n=1 Tax=Methanogenium organophilum TaxID=2199 RepID=A0A9X9S565_METOG|nr:alpha/beta fold hydrolase [Methanogenium organophilum]WAI02279.1 alpha/beta fold hydrolase [Methanogenium organophilum]
MATFLLVHGAMHGGWCWKRVTPLLEAAGHRVLTPTLTGMGERYHLLTPETGLSTHVLDLLGTLYFEDLTDVIAVGHSYGGMVISQLADRASDQLAGLIFLDAFTGHDGAAMWDFQPEETRSLYLQWAARGGDGWRIPPTDAFVQTLGITEDADRAWVQSRLTDFPVKCQHDTLSLFSGGYEQLPKGYIHCTESPLAPKFWPFFDEAEGEGWPCRSISASHDAMVTHPALLARSLTDVTGEW